jgi:hypothetical protein
MILPETVAVSSIVHGAAILALDDRGTVQEAMRVADALAPASPHSTALKAMPSAPATRSPGRRHTG